MTSTAGKQPGEEVLTLSIDAGIAVLTFNQPDKGNAWSKIMGTAYFNTLQSLAVDERVRVIVVTGAGKSFCVGADPTVLGSISTGEHTPDTDTGADHPPYYYPMSIGKPVIAAINGACFGIGLQLALCCDLRFLADDGKIATAYARRGLVAELGMSWLLPRLVGRGMAMDMLLSARVVRPDEAFACGLVNRVFPAAKLLDETLAYARTLAEKCGPRALREIKQQLNLDESSDFDKAFARSEQLLAEAYHFADFAEGVASWKENRAPEFAPLPPELAHIKIQE